jgi:hypothetical protein
VWNEIDHGTGDFQEEISIFEVAEQAQIERDRDRQQPARRAIRQTAREAVVHADLCEQQEQERHAPIGIEHHRQPGQGRDSGSAVRGHAEQMEDQQRDRQEAKNEDRVAEDHAGLGPGTLGGDRRGQMANHLVHVLQRVDLARAKPDAEGALAAQDDLDLVQAVPGRDVAGCRAGLQDDRCVVEDLPEHVLQLRLYIGPRHCPHHATACSAKT